MAGMKKWLPSSLGKQGGTSPDTGEGREGGGGGPPGGGAVWDLVQVSEMGKHEIPSLPHDALKPQFL